MHPKATSTARRTSLNAANLLATPEYTADDPTNGTLRAPAQAQFVESGEHGNFDTSIRAGTTRRLTPSKANDLEPDKAPPRLEFITWGTSKLSDFEINVMQEAKGVGRGVTVNRNHGQGLEDPLSSAGPFSEPARAVELYHLQALLPTKQQVLQMVEYHERCLHWFQGCFHGPSFRHDLIKAYQSSTTLQLKDLDYRWSALLFSIIAASITCARDATVVSWGFSGADKARLSKKWYHATMSCLMLGEYSSKYHVHSIQAIVVSNLSAHLLGYSKAYAVHFSSAIAIAKGLGLHRLGPSVDQDIEESGPILSKSQRDSVISREVGRRLWSYLCTHDWICANSTGMYAINRRHFTSIKPNHYDDETMKLIGNHAPAITHYTNYLQSIASLMAEFHDSLLSADTSAQYNEVLRYDSKVRALEAEEMPKFFSLQTPTEPSWPEWIAWARRSSIVVHAHKVIVIHQSFLSKSFKSPRFAYTRWACTAASKTIVANVEEGCEGDGPMLWVEQAFVVAAGITLALDIFYRTESESEFWEHWTWINRAIHLLQKFPKSELAVHGTRLLVSLLKERSRKSEIRQDAVSSSPKDCPSPDRHLDLDPQAERPNKRPRHNSSSILQSVNGRDVRLSIPQTGQSSLSMRLDNIGQVHDGNVPILGKSSSHGDSMDLEEILHNFPPQVGWDSSSFFEDMLELDFM